MVMTKDQITNLLEPYDRILALECDGFCRVASRVLTDAGIEHEVMEGSVSSSVGDIPLHYWIMVGGLHVDYRMRMWLGDEAPHGVFEHLPEGFEYEGWQVVQMPCSDLVFEILTGSGK